jgi:hypothetical protein
VIISLFILTIHRHHLTMSDEEHFDDAHMDAVSSTPTDFFDHDPSRAEKIEVRSRLSHSMWNQGNVGIASSLLLLIISFS